MLEARASKKKTTCRGASNSLRPEELSGCCREIVPRFPEKLLRKLLAKVLPLKPSGVSVSGCPTS